MSARTVDADAAIERSDQLGDRASRARLRQALLPWLFLAPALLLLGLFTFWPVLWGSYLAFTEYNFLTPPKWVGLANFEDLLEDPVFFISLKNSLLYLLIVPAIQLGAIVLAVLVNNSLPGIKAFRAAFYIPVVTSVSVVGIMWGWMYNEQGLINAVLQTLHVINDPIGWLSDDRLALFSLMLVTLLAGPGLVHGAVSRGAAGDTEGSRGGCPARRRHALAAILEDNDPHDHADDSALHGPVDALGDEGAGGGADHDQRRSRKLDVYRPLLRVRSGHPRVQLSARAGREPRRERFLSGDRMAQLPLHTPASPLNRWRRTRHRIRA